MKLITENIIQGRNKIRGRRKILNIQNCKEKKNQTDLNNKKKHGKCAVKE